MIRLSETLLVLTAPGRTRSRLRIYGFAKLAALELILIFCREHSPESTESDPPLANLTHGSERAAFEEWERLWKSILRKHERRMSRSQDAGVSRCAMIAGGSKEQHPRRE